MNYSCLGSILVYAVFSSCIADSNIDPNFIGGPDYDLPYINAEIPKVATVGETVWLNIHVISDKADLGIPIDSIHATICGGIYDRKVSLVGHNRYEFKIYLDYIEVDKNTPPDDYYWEVNIYDARESWRRNGTFSVIDICPRPQSCQNVSEELTAIVTHVPFSTPNNSEIYIYNFNTKQRRLMTSMGGYCYCSQVRTDELYVSGFQMKNDSVWYDGEDQFTSLSQPMTDSTYITSFVGSWLNPKTDEYILVNSVKENCGF